MIDDYLTEELLGKFIEERIDNSFQYNKYIKEYKIKPDYISDKHKLVIEFDGYRHYNNSKVIIKDYYKDKVYNEMGYDLIRIPYFVQLDKSIIKLLFHKFVKNVKSFNNYPHGFIDNKALLPSDFCSLGLNRFINDLSDFTIIRNDILQSLDDKTELLGDERLVMPDDKVLDFYLINFRLGNTEKASYCLN